MKKKILITSLIIIGFSAKLMAQEVEEVPKAKQEEKVIIRKTHKAKKGEKTTVIIDDKKVTVDGEDVAKISGDDVKLKDGKKITVMIDGDNITINGKPVEQLSDKDIDMLKSSADHLGAVAPYMKGSIKGNFPEGLIDGNFEMPENDFKIMIDAPGVNKALLGVTTEKNDKGAAITNVSKESGAEKAGLQKGDIITKINDDKIENSEDLVKTIGKYKPEDKITIQYLRDGKTKKTDAVLGKNNMQLDRVFKWNNSDNMPEEMAPIAGLRPNFKMEFKHRQPKMGIKVQDVEEGYGVKVLDVDDNTPASKSGLKKDDIITEINGTEIKNVDDLKDKTSDVKEGDVLKVKYSRNGISQSSEIKFPKKLKTADL